MQPFQIFKPGRHRAASGVTLDFSEDMLRAAVEAYDPELHEAPIVVGHPKDNHPAFGWIKSLQFGEGDNLEAVPGEVNADFAELVASGAYKKRSASWYLPDSPNNPKPGTLYLRHVGFLGAQPPAIKGLKDVSFNEAEEGVVEFADSSWVASLLASTMRRLREWIIADKGVDAADAVVPAYVVSELEAEARKPVENTPAPMVASFTEEKVMLTEEQIKALEAENAMLKAKAKQAADFAEAEKTLKAREEALARKEIGAEIDALVAAGKVLPAQKAGLVEFMAALADDGLTVEFGEGDQAKKLSQRQFMRDYLAAMPKIIDFSERSAGTGGGEEFDVNKAQAKILAQVTSGKAGA